MSNPTHSQHRTHRSHPSDIATPHNTQHRHTNRRTLLETHTTTVMLISRFSMFTISLTVRVWDLQQVRVIVFASMTSSALLDRRALVCDCHSHNIIMMSARFHSQPASRGTAPDSHYALGNGHKHTHTLTRHTNTRIPRLTSSHCGAHVNHHTHTMPYSLPLYAFYILILASSRLSTLTHTHTQLIGPAPPKSARMCAKCAND